MILVNTLGELVKPKGSTKKQYLCPSSSKAVSLWESGCKGTERKAFLRSKEARKSWGSIREAMVDLSVMSVKDMIFIKISKRPELPFLYRCIMIIAVIEFQTSRLTPSFFTLNSPPSKFSSKTPNLEQKMYFFYCSINLLS